MFVIYFKGGCLIMEFTSCSMLIHHLQGARGHEIFWKITLSYQKRNINKYLSVNAAFKIFFNSRYGVFISLIRIIRMTGIIKSLDRLFTRLRHMSANDLIMPILLWVKNKSQSWNLTQTTTHISWFSQDNFSNKKKTFSNWHFWYSSDCHSDFRFYFVMCD